MKAVALGLGQGACGRESGREDSQIALDELLELGEDAFQEQCALAINQEADEIAQELREAVAEDLCDEVVLFLPGNLGALQEVTEAGWAARTFEVSRACSTAASSVPCALAAFRSARA